MMVSGPNIIHVEDGRIHQEVVQGLLDGINANLITVPSLACLEENIRTRRIDVGILDGRFFDRPGGRVALYLGTAYDLLRNAGARAIYILSSESLATIQSELGSDRVPDAIFQKGPAIEGSMGVEMIGEVIEAKLRAIYPQLYLH